MNSGSWTCVLESAALRRDAKSFLFIIIVQPRKRRTQADEVSYFARFFDTVDYNGEFVNIRRNGLLHRIGGGPAVIGDGYSAWFEHGVYHRVDGPARVFKEGYPQWWLHGELQWVRSKS